MDGNVSVEMCKQCVMPTNTAYRPRLAGDVHLQHLNAAGDAAVAHCEELLSIVSLYAAGLLSVYWISGIPVHLLLGHFNGPASAFRSRKKIEAQWRRPS
jgi:hypothetical protein